MKTRRKTKVHPWEHALTCPLPAGTDYYQLKDLQGHLLEYLRFLPHHFALDIDTPNLDLSQARDAEIQRAADRLKKISRMIVAADQPTTTKLPPQNTSPARRMDSRVTSNKSKETRLIRTLLGEAVETILVNIAASGTKRDIAKAEWLISEIQEDATRFPDFKPLDGRLAPWFKAWRKGTGPSL